MTEAQIRNMQAARAAKALERQAQDTANVLEFRAWLREDAQTFRTFLDLTASRPGSPEHRAAHAAWRRVAERMPAPPRDAAWPTHTTKEHAA